MNTFFSANTLKVMSEHLIEKLIASAGLAKIAEILGVHVQFFLAFAFLMVLDVFTRYLAQTALLWHDLYPNTPYTLYDLFNFRVQSRKWRYFRSEEMRKKFISKAGTYIIILGASAVCDLVMQVADGKPFVLMLVTAFLSLTELLSIMENLQECGVKEIADLMKIIKSRKEAIK